MVGRALRAVLLFAGLFGLGVAGVWWAGWLPWQPAPRHVARGPETQVTTAQERATPSLSAPAPDPVTQQADGDDLTLTSARPAPMPPRPEVTATRPAEPHAALPLPTPTVSVRAPRPPTSPTADPTPLDAVNAIRTLADLPAVTRTPAFDPQCAAHAAYLVRADRGEHLEDPHSPYRSAAGEACAPGHYFVSSQPASGPERAVVYWATGGFHLPQLIDPRLHSVALGMAHDTAGSVQSAAVLDVRRGLTGRAAYPVRFPAPGRVSPLMTAATGEWPDPTAACRGYTAPLGAPIALLLGPGQAAVGAAMKVNGRAVAACLLTERTFLGRSEADTRAGRGVLAAQGAAVLLPRRPLPAGASVRVGFRTPAGRAGWSFRVR